MAVAAEAEYCPLPLSRYIENINKTTVRNQNNRAVPFQITTF
jgi:hypothetical protein